MPVKLSIVALSPQIFGIFNLLIIFNTNLARLRYSFNIREIFNRSNIDRGGKSLLIATYLQKAIMVDSKYGLSSDRLFSLTD